MHVTTTTTVTLGGVQYLVHPQPLGQVVLKSRLSKGLVPAILLPPDAQLTLEAIERLLAAWRLEDDVFGGAPAAFSNVLMVQRGQDTKSNRLQGSTGVVTITSANQACLPPGPYFIHKDQIHQAWRLYPDTLGTFLVPLVSDSALSPSSFSVLPHLSSDGLHKTIAVPSRLASLPTQLQPLHGRRLALEETYDVAGIRKTLGSRDFARHDALPTTHADHVQKLLDLGAVVLGTIKTAPLALDDSSSAYHTRADGHLHTGATSTGPALALAGYEWVDLAVGGDTDPGLCIPAAANGVYALRATHGISSMAGTVPCAPTFDTVGLLSRSLRDLRTWAHSSLPLVKSDPVLPRTLVCPKELLSVEGEKAQMFYAAVKVLEGALGVQKTDVCLSDTWDRTPPPEAQGEGMHSYLEKCGAETMCREYYNAYAPFRASFKAAYGHDPYEPPAVSAKWNTARGATDAQANEGLARRRVFRAWFDKNIMCANDDTTSNTVLVLPMPSANDGDSEPSRFESVSARGLSPVLGIPQIVVPFAQLPFHSRTTDRIEHLPISISMLGAKGSELMLIDLARQAFSAAHWPTTIKAGRLMFEIGDNVQHTALVVPDETKESDAAVPKAEVEDAAIMTPPGTAEIEAIDDKWYDAHGVDDKDAENVKRPLPLRTDSLAPVLAHGVGQAL